MGLNRRYKNPGLAEQKGLPAITGTEIDFHLLRKGKSHSWCQSSSEEGLRFFGSRRFEMLIWQKRLVSFPDAQYFLL